MEQTSKNGFLVTLIVLLFLGNVLFIWQYWKTQAELTRVRAELTQIQTNDKVVSFLRLFINTVLKAENEVAFQKRLQLEDSVRALNDSDVLEAWTRFVNSTTELEAQTNTKNLLGILADKIQIKTQ